MTGWRIEVGPRPRLWRRTSLRRQGGVRPRARRLIHARRIKLAVQRRQHRQRRRRWVVTRRLYRLNRSSPLKLVVVLGLSRRIAKAFLGSADLIQKLRPNSGMRPRPKAADLG